MDILERIRELKEGRSYDRAKFEEIADEIEEAIGPAEMWSIVRVGFTTDELIENLEFIAREADL